MHSPHANRARPAYTPPGATLYAEIATGQPGPAAPAWPLTTVSLADVLTESDGNGLHLTGADAQAALHAAPRVAPFVEHGVSYLVVAHPNPASSPAGGYGAAGS